MWLKVKAILIAKLEPTKATSEAFLAPMLEDYKIPPYFAFSRHEHEVIIKSDMKFVALPNKIRKEVVDDNFKKCKIRSQWRMRLYLKAKKAPYGEIPQDLKFPEFIMKCMIR
jgi:hypothetical protein